MKREGLRLRLARWLEPAAGQPAGGADRAVHTMARPAGAPEPAPATAGPGGAPEPVARPAPPPGNPWPGICEQFALQLLLFTEQLRPALDRLETDEDDPDRLRRLYQVDHAVTRMRRSARDLRVLAGREEEELAGYTTSLVDVIRMAESAIERYTQVSITTVAELAVLPYVADDIASLLAALLENATNYSPSAVTVSAHLLDDGAVMIRIEDSGIGIPPDQLVGLNATLASRVPDVNDHTGKHSGFPVVHRLARKHGIRVRLACRQPSRQGAPGGTIAMVSLPAQLLCEIPVSPMDGIGEPMTGAASRAVPATDGEAAVSYLTVATGPVEAGPVPTSQGVAGPPAPTTANGLPRRERMSLRGPEPKLAPAPSRASAQDSAQAAKAFAEDLSAFAAGGEEARRQSPAGAGDDRPEEQVP
jgi:hypothetical protein